MSKESLDKILIILLGSDELVKKWWKSPNTAFNNKTPNQQYEEDSNIVTVYVVTQTTGDFM